MFESGELSELRGHVFQGARCAPPIVAGYLALDSNGGLNPADKGIGQKFRFGNGCLAKNRIPYVLWTNLPVRAGQWYK
jgi:hypothetical protein